MNKIHGNLTGLAPAQIKGIEQLYRRRMPPERIITHDLARQLTTLSREINRQIGLLISRRGEIAFVVVGSHKDILIPGLDSFRSSSSRFRGLRLIHTHLDGENLTTDDLTDLALLRLDLVCAIDTDPDGLPGKAYTAHLIPENLEGTFWMQLPPAPPSGLTLNFLSFIQALEGEFTKKQKTRKVDATDRAILIRVETNPRAESEYALDELKELARSCGVEVFDTIMKYRTQMDPKFLLGKGQLSDLVIRALQMGANLLIFDHELTAAQIKSITDFTEIRVVDRTQVILDIFARRAHSREGKIQVELAQLQYLLPRLVTKNTAMSRLTGGIGARGPGETKLEINRRRVRDRIHRLQKELQTVQKARGVRRVKRERMGRRILSIVGYTNAGKSTLLNVLTKSEVFTENLLFATLDPKSSRLRFPRDREAIITDTVGFIRDLPKELFAAFRATLDELHEADILLHVIDISNPNFENHITAVENILQELDITGKPTIRVFNKEDHFPDKSLLNTLCQRFGATAISALHLETLPPLMIEIENLMTKGQISHSHSYAKPF